MEAAIKNLTMIIGIAFVSLYAYPGPTFSQTRLDHFKDGETIVAEVVFEGLDSDFEADTELTGRPVRETTARQMFAEKFAPPIENRPLDVYEVGKGIKILKSWLFREGFVDADVKAIGEKLPNGKMRLIYSIERADRKGVIAVEIDGNKAVAASSLRANFVNCIPDAWQRYSRQTYEYINDRCVRQYLFSLGYFRAKVFTKRVEFQPSGIVVTVGIYEGPRFLVGKIEINGNRVFDRKTILDILELQPGEVADARRLRFLVFEKLKELYGNQGYLDFDAELTPSIHKPAEPGGTGTVDFEITINEGKQFRVGEISFPGLEIEKWDRLRKQIEMKPGDVFRWNVLKMGIEAISALGAYGFIDFDRDVELISFEDPSSTPVLLRKADSMRALMRRPDTVSISISVRR